MALFKQSKLAQITARESKPANLPMILVVDDEEANRRVLCNLLDHDYEVLQAATGQAAWEVIQTLSQPERLACIVSDQRMPGMTGVELLQQSREHYPDAVRVIVTGYSDVDAIIDSINKADIYRFIIKPFDSNDFLLTIKRAMENFELRQRLAEHQRELEQRILLRTAELEQANTALRQHQSELELARELAESASRQKSDFLAVMSHELRTPLSGIIGMLKLGLRGQMDEISRERCELSLNNAQALMSLVTDLLDFSKIEAGKLELEEIAFPLVPTISSALAIFDERAMSRGVDFVLDLASNLPDYVKGDPTRLRQILLNLVGNAIKFTEQGWVKVIVTLQHQDSHGSTLEFQVQDSGIGIAPQALTRLFQKFEQGDVSTTRRYGGTGLGLAISRQLVELMGGEISVSSEVGVGSNFRFQLKMAHGSEQMEQIDRADDAASHQLHILCAEDFPTNQIIIRTLLEDRGHRVQLVENGWQAVQAMAKDRFDVILMDGRMPEMDGPSATRLIRSGGTAEYPISDSQIHIIALTANVSAHDQAAYLAAGMDDFLTKPIDEHQLHLLLRKVIAQRLAQGAALQPLLRPSQADLANLFALDLTELEPAPTAPPSSDQRGSLLSRMRQSFVQDWPLRETQLEQALQAHDQECAARILHGLKGSLAYLDCSLSLQNQCGTMEQDADHGHWPSLDREWPVLQSAVLSLLKQWQAVDQLDSHSPPICKGSQDESLTG